MRMINGVVHAKEQVIDPNQVIKRLRQLQHTKTGDPWPEWLSQSDWGGQIGHLCGLAADLLEMRLH